MSLSQRRFAWTAAVLLCAAPLAADVVVLKDGKRFEGEATERGETYDVKTPYGVLTFKKEDVKRVVRNVAEAIAEAALCRKLGRGIYDEAMQLTGNPRQLQHKLRAAVELFEKALKIYQEARDLFPGPEHASLDETLASVIQELRLCRDKVTTEILPAADPPPSHAVTKMPDVLVPVPPPDAPLKVSEAIEGESMDVVACSGGAAAPVTKMPVGTGPFSGNAALVWRGGKAGDRLKLRFPAPESGRKSLVLALVKSTDYGIVRIAVNGKTLAPAVDLYASKGPAPYEKSFSADLKAGANELEFELVGSNAAAKSADPGLPPCLAGLDYALIRPPGGAPPPGANPATLQPGAASPAEALLEEAKKAVERKQYVNARASLERLLKQHAEAPAAAEAKTLLDSIPHPDGRLVNGFDKPEDVKAWRVQKGYRHPAVFELVTTPPEVRDGAGAAKFALSKDAEYSSGCILTDLQNFDGKRFRGLSLWIYQSRPSPGRLEIAFIRSKLSRLPWQDYYGGGSLGSSLFVEIPLGFTGWQQIKIPAAQFQQRGGPMGKIGWADAGTLVLYDGARKGFEVILDNLRFLEDPK